MNGFDNLDIKTKGVTTPLDAASLPNFMPSNKQGLDFKKLRVRYLKLDMDDLADISELEKIETKSIRNEGCYVMAKKEFIFMDRIFILVQYLEEATE